MRESDEEPTTSLEPKLRESEEQFNPNYHCPQKKYIYVNEQTSKKKAKNKEEIITDRMRVARSG